MSAPIGLLADIEAIRLIAWGRAACQPFADHQWIRFVHPADDGLTLTLLCVKCGREPSEALAAVGVVVSR